jgi:hypothetical protein
MLKFVKNIVPNHRLSDGTIIDNGFEYNFGDKGHLLFTGQDYRLSYDTEMYLVNKSFYITDIEASVQIGHYKLSNWTVFFGYNDKLIWQEQEYKFKKIKPDIRYSLFNKDTWGHFKFQLSNDNEIVTYIFKIDAPAISVGNPYTDKPFEGSIDIDSSSPLTALAGLILVERALDNETIT